ncbi:Clavaminate synthase [Rhizoctonia solani]|uniref:Clavaminate synthase n=1 Tax=Rhizoctonia solani TaxID=456999 RepID=A0A8H7IDV9_9AGAM|nr:Clavaminate synthase [Rhizoctonia solani]
MSSFEEIPVLDWSLLSAGAESRAKFISQLRSAMTEVGFLYLLNPPIDDRLVQSVIDYAPKLFDLPQETKESLAMVNNEVFDFATPWKGYRNPEGPDYERLWGPAQWPSDTDLPGFRDAYSAYYKQCADLSFEFMSLLAEALGLPSDAFDRFYDAPRDIMLHRAKVVKYPAMPEGSSDQGVGPHFDGGFLTLLLQASPHPGLQAQNARGEWIPAPPRPRTLQPATGFGATRISNNKRRPVQKGGSLYNWTTDGLSTSPSGARYSIPFFQSISQDVRVSENQLDFPQETLDLLKNRKGDGATESVNFSEYARGQPSGHVQLIGRIKSHPDVGERHYPELFKELFPVDFRFEPRALPDRPPIFTSEYPCNF